MAEVEIDNSIIPIVHTLGIIQGLVLGMIFLFLNKKNRSTFFLGLFLIGLAIELLPILLNNVKLIEYNAYLLSLPMNLSWLLFPIFFIYVQKISILSKEKITYWVLYPGIASIIIQLILFWAPESIRVFLRDNFIYEIFFGLGLLYSLYIIFLIHKYINEHITEVRNQYASDKDKQLQWIRFALIFGFVLISIRMGTLFMENVSTLHLILSALSIVIITVIAYFGIVQYNVFSALPHGESKEKEQNVKKLMDTSISTGLIEDLDQYMDETEIYREQNLSIVDVASALKVHPHLLSKAINQHYGMHFNRYINTHRIKKAQGLIATGILDHMSIEGLSAEVGFHSKTSLYTWFKRIAETTPIHYQKEHRPV